MKNNQPAFTREDTSAIKGIAIIMMLLHHLAGFTNRFPVGFDGFYSKSDWFVKEGFLTTLAFNMNFCVALFLFLGGYGMYLRVQKNSYSLTASILGLFKRYWKIFVIFVPIAFIFFSRSGDGVSELASRYKYENIRQLITIITSNFTMLSYSINAEWWFMRTYICALLVGAVYIRLTKKINNFSGEILLVFLLDMFFRSVLPALPKLEVLSGLSYNFFFGRFISETSVISSFFAGIVFAKYSGIIRMKELMSRVPFKSVLGLSGAFIVIWSRCFVVNGALDAVYAPVFTVFMSVFFDSLKPMKKFWKVIGMHSTNMWLVHSFYCYYFLEATHIVYSTRNVWIDLGILASMSFLTSILVELFYKYLFKGAAYISSKLPKNKAALTPEPQKAEKEKVNV